jgi:hypothetical protein
MSTTEQNEPNMTEQTEQNEHFSPGLSEQHEHTPIGVFGVRPTCSVKGVLARVFVRQP